MNALCELAIRNNLVNYAAAGGSIYNLNGDTIKDYPFIFVSPTDEITVGDNTTTYGLTIFYADRMLESDYNGTQVYSIATDTITNFLRQVEALEGVVDVGDYTIRIFSETKKMDDALNGAYARVRITVLNTAACAQWFDETGAPLGTYIPTAIQDVSILENLASKPWVIQYVASHSEGTDEKTVQKMINKSLKDYTKTSDFATINGSGITSGETYDLLERDVFNEFLSGYSTDMQEIRQEISAATPADYDELRTQVSANTEDIRTLSGATESLSGTVSGLSGGLDTLSGTVSEISGATVQNTQDIGDLSASTFDLYESIGVVNNNVSSLSGSTSALTQDLSNLSAYTETIGSNLGDLSGFTAQAVSSITSDVDALSGATSAALSGLSGDVAELSGVTGGLEAQIAAIASSESAAVFDLREYGVYNGVLMDVYNDMVSAYTTNKTIFLVTAVKVTNASNGRTCPTIAPATVGFDEQNRLKFNFEFMSHLTGAPAGIYTSNAVYFTATGATGLFEYSWLNERYYIADSSLGRYMAYSASKFDTGCVRLSSGMTQDVYGEASVALGSGLTYGSNLEVQVNVGSGLTFGNNGEINVDSSYSGNVSSQSVTKIWSGSLQDYQTLGTYSNDTLYLII